MNKLLLSLALMSAVAAHAAMPTDCAADISKQLQQDSEVHVNVRPNAKLCVNVNEPIISVEYTNGDQLSSSQSESFLPLRWQTPLDGGYTMVIRAAEDAYPMRWNSIISDGNTLVMTAPEDAYPVGVYVKTAAGKTYHFQAAQTNGLDY